MSVPDAAMVLAAGLGRRMLPLTSACPKPLVRVAGKTLLDRAFDLLAEAGVGRAVVNVHYMADKVEEHLRQHPPALAVALSDERARLLETGGGLVRALPMIPCDPFLALNADNFWGEGEGAVATLARHWDGARMEALLLLVPRASAHGHKGAGDFDLDAEGRLVRRPPGSSAAYVYTGLQMLAKTLFRGERAEPFSANRLWDKAAAEGRLYGVPFDGFWCDVGTAAAVAEAEEIAARLALRPAKAPRAAR